MGDFKPSAELIAKLPDEILRGIDNHRLVDRLTDSFQPVKALRPLFSDKRRRYAGVISDIAFDYYLIKHWELFEDSNFDEFIEQCYAGLRESTEWMPERMAYVVSKMDEYDWLSSYESMNGIAATIDQVSKRLRFDNHMAGGVEEIEANYEQLEETFLALFDHLRRAVNEAELEAKNG